MPQSSSEALDQFNFDLAENHSKARAIALDYALLAAIIGLNPFSNLLLIAVLATAILTLKMIRDIGAKWGFSNKQDLLAIAGSLFGFLGGFAMAFMAWLTIIIISIWIPVAGSFAVSASLFTWVWMIGQSTNQFYLTGSKNYKRNQRGI